MRNVVVIILLLCAANLSGLAQSYHHSQFYSVPMLINPATTGATGGPYRVGINYRSQWHKNGSPYTTFVASGDAHILKESMGEQRALGVGLVFLNDKALDGIVQTNRFSLSTGYHLSLDPSNIQKLSAGFQGTYNENRVDFARLQFENQYCNGGYDPNLPSGEIFSDGKKQYFDISAGLMYSMDLDDRSFFGGISMYNILKQEESYQTEQFKAPSLLSLMGGGEIDFGYNNSLFFSGNYRSQDKNNELTLGMAWGVFLDQTGYTSLRLGMWHRLNDAIIPYVGVSYAGFQVGTSFDFNVSSKTESQLRNTFEVSVVYTGEDKTELMRLIPWY